jgi:hypothetical protein
MGMSKKDLANVTADLSALAAFMPTQRAAAATASNDAPAAAELAQLKPAAAPKAKAKAERAGEPEEVSQFSFGLRKGLRKQLGRLADDADMTMRAFVLNALKEKGLDVRADDLLDLRKDRR